MNGKGSKPRNCFSKQFKDNYDGINWCKKEKIDINGLPYYVFKVKSGWVVESDHSSLCAKGLTKNSAIKSIKKILATHNKITKMVDTFSNKR